MELFFPITLAAIVIGVIIYLACEKHRKPKEQTPEQWYEDYKKSCFVPEWMEKLNSYELKEGDRVVCIQYGRYGLTGIIDKIIMVQMHMFHPPHQIAFEIKWDTTYYGSNKVNRPYLLKIDDAPNKPVKKNVAKKKR